MVKSIWEEYKWYIVGAGGLLLLLAGILLFNNDGEEIEVVEAFPDEELEDEIESEESAPEMPSTVFIEVKGAVKKPGVYEIAQDARVNNVLDMAEVLPNADLNTVNQSQKVADEMMIYVPAEGEEIDPQLTVSAQTSEDASIVNINTGTANDLTALNGIGEKKAALIVEYREANGLFMKKEDLMNISGIGEKTFESLEPYITID